MGFPFGFIDWIGIVFFLSRLNSIWMTFPVTLIFITHWYCSHIDKSIRFIVVLYCRSWKARCGVTSGYREGGSCGDKSVIPLGRGNAKLNN